MSAKKKSTQALLRATTSLPMGYDGVLRELMSLIESARRAAARSVNAVMTATYFLVGRAVVEEEQRGAKRAAYGEELLARLGADLTKRFGRGFSPDNLETMRRFYLAYGSVGRKSEPPSRKFGLDALAQRFPLPWSHYALLVRRARSDVARSFYETEGLRGGWTVRQLQRQVDSQFYERTALSRNKVAMLEKGGLEKPSPPWAPILAYSQVTAIFRKLPSLPRLNRSTRPLRLCSHRRRA